MFNKYVSRSHQLAFHAVIDSPVKAETAKVLSSNDVLFHLIRTPKYNKGEEQKKTKKSSKFSAWEDWKQSTFWHFAFFNELQIHFRTLPSSPL